MSDINFIEESGIKNQKLESKRPVNDNSKDENKPTLESNKKIIISDSGKFNFNSFIISLFVILFFVFTFQVYSYNSKHEIKNISVVHILKMMSQYDDVQLQTISSNNEKIKLIIKCSESTFYDIINLLAEFKYNVKGNVSNNEYIIHIDEEWYIDYAKNLHVLKEKLEDFKGMKSELVFNNLNSEPEQLIIISDYEELISLIEMFERYDIIHSQYFDINKSKKNDNYFEIIFNKYD